MDLKIVIRIIEFFIPVITSITCGLIVLLSYWESMSRIEEKIKRLLIIYYCLVGFTWMMLLVYWCFPPLFAALHSFFYLSMLLIPVVFYHFICVLTSFDRQRTFSYLHYLLPSLIFLVSIVWSFFIPDELKLELVTDTSKRISGYKAYSIFFSSKLLVRFLLNILYTGLTLYHLYKYYMAVVQKKKRYHRLTSHWIVLLIGSMIVLLLASLNGISQSHHSLLDSIPTVVTVFMIAIQMVMIVYNIMRRNYLIFISDPEELIPLQKDSNNRKQDLEYSLGDRPEPKYTVINKDVPVIDALSRKQFENYMKKNKPYLDPELKITYLASELKINRSNLSAFINGTYGMNFSKYINFCRLQEMERLQSIHPDKDAIHLTRKAGFGSYRNYLRTKQQESEKSQVTKE